MWKQIFVQIIVTEVGQTVKMKKIAKVCGKNESLINELFE